MEFIEYHVINLLQVNNAGILENRRVTTSEGYLFYSISQDICSILYPHQIDNIILFFPLFNKKTRYELNFAVNVLGTYGMTELMLPLLEKTQPDARVITVASGGMYTAPLTTDLQVLKNFQVPIFLWYEKGYTN